MGARRGNVTSRLRVIVTGLIAQHPWLGGVTWDYLQYVIGLARLGHDVFYVEDSGEWPYKRDGGPRPEDRVAYDCSDHVGHLARIMARFGLDGRWAYRFPHGSRWFGLSDQKRRAVIESADLLLNVSGTLICPEDYRRIPRLAYIDSDPVFTQVRFVAGGPGFRARVNTHDVHFSFGERVSEGLPATGHDWRPTRQPVLLSEWRHSMPRRDAFTTVMNWTSYEPLSHAGRTYSQKDVELRRFLRLPERVHPATLEVALSKPPHDLWQTADGATPADSPTELLSGAGWRIVDPMVACPDLDSYRVYIQSSMAEWSVAKHGYVVGKPGWFSCRSACYLAAGRPVIVQDTGFSSILPVGEGILVFGDLEEAAEAVRAVTADHDRHAKAAQAIAEAYFDSDVVLARLLEDAVRSLTPASPAIPPGE